MTIKMKNFIIMHPDDNCGTALKDILPQTELYIKDRVIVIIQFTPLGHKIALIDIEKGDFVKKYGQIIGKATRIIKAGEWIHTHNLTSYYLEVKKNS